MTSTVSVINVALDPEVRTALRLVAVAEGKTYSELITEWTRDRAQELGVDDAAKAAEGTRP